MHTAQSETESQPAVSILVRILLFLTYVNRNFLGESLEVSPKPFLNLTLFYNSIY